MRHTLLICLLVLALVLALLFGIAAPGDVQAQFDAGAQAPTTVTIDNTVIVALLALILPVTTLLINFFTTRATTEQARTIAHQARTIDALIVKLDGLPNRLAEVLANARLKDQFADALSEALVKLGVPVTEQPKESPQLPLTPLKPIDLLQQLELEKLDRDAASESAASAVDTPADKPADAAAA